MMIPFPCEPGLPGALLAAGVVVPHQQPPQVRIDAACLHRFQIVPVGRATRWFTERGLTRRVMSGERDFDERWSVETDDVEFGEALVRLPEARQAVTALAELGGCWISQGGKHLTAVLGKAEKSRLKDPARKAAVEAGLRVLAGLCETLQQSRHFPQRRGKSRLFVGLAAGAGALLVLAIVLCVSWGSELVDGEAGLLALRSLLVGLPIGLAALAAATVPFAGRSTSHKEFGVLALLLLPTVMLASFAGALAANRFLDPGPAVQHRVPVVAVHERHNKDKLTGYWAVVPDWHLASDGPLGGHEAGDGDHTRRISFGTRSGSELVPGRSELLLVVSPGRFGAERLLTAAVQTPPER